MTLIHVAWCLIPLAYFAVLAFGDPRTLAEHQPIRSFAELVVRIRGESIAIGRPDYWLTREVAAKAVSLFLLPISTVAAFVSLWRFRASHLRVFKAQRRTPPLMVEPVALSVLFGGAYVHYFLGPIPGCVFCLDGGTVAEAIMESAALFVFSYIPYGIGATIYTRINYDSAL